MVKFDKYFFNAGLDFDSGFICKFLDHAFLLCFANLTINERKYVKTLLFLQRVEYSNPYPSDKKVPWAV
jgi:hypothetical protein